MEVVSCKVEQRVITELDKLCMMLGVTRSQFLRDNMEALIAQSRSKYVVKTALDKLNNN